MAPTASAGVLVLMLLPLLLQGPEFCVQAQNSVDTLADISIPEDNHLGPGKQISYRAQEQRAIFDLVTGILETLQTSARAQIERERRKQLLEAVKLRAQDVAPPSDTKT